MRFLNSIISFLNRHIANIAILVIAAVLLKTDFDLKFWKEKERLLIWDVKTYYVYLPAAFIYKDFSLQFVKEKKPELGEIMFLEKGPKGIYTIMTTYGQALLYSPFFFGAHAYSLITGDGDGNGYSPPYKFALMLSSVFYLAIGLYFLKKLLLKFFNSWITAITLVVMALGTNLYYYATYEAPMTHAYNFAMIAAFMYFTVRWHEKATAWNSITLGFLAGLITLVRPVNLIVLLFFILWGVYSWRSFADRIIFLLRSYQWILLMILIFFILWIPQFIYWKYVSGNYLYYSYSDQRFFFNNPQIYSSLFSYRKGLLVYIPVLIFAFIGIPLLYKKYRGMILPVAAVAFLNIYILSSWCFWWFGGSFGPRSYIDTYAILAIPFAALTARLANKKLFYLAIPYLAVVGALVWFNFFQSKQYINGAINWTAMTKEAYWDSFLNKYPSKEYPSLLRFPNRDSALKGIYYKGDLTYEEMYPHKKTTNKPAEIINDIEDYIRNFEKTIRQYDKWFQQIKDKAAERGISVDSMIRKDAIWLYEREQLQQKNAVKDSLSSKNQ